jgi:hypothetical protein
MSLPDYAGTCLCGNVQWTSRRRPELQFNCYCRDCRRSTGAAFVPIMFFLAEDLSVTGTLTYFASVGGSGHAIHRGFCTHCGAQVIADVDLMPGMRSIRAGTLLDINMFKPGASIFVSQAPGWLLPAPDLPSFARLPNTRP